ncbi:MAG: hypothetical protein HYY76_16350 [Acidobacteria bacterium]|nr:hypothetical protein [Acidobacteriota bacterium]
MAQDQIAGSRDPGQFCGASLTTIRPSLLKHQVGLGFVPPAALTFAWALRRSAQYFFILSEIARLAAAEI